MLSKIVTGFYKRLGLTLTLSAMTSCAISFISVGSIHSLVVASNWVDHTNVVLKESENVISTLKDIEIGQRSYLYTRDKSYLILHEKAKLMIEPELKNLAQLVSDNPNQLQRIELLSQLVNQRIALSDQTITYEKQGNDSEALNLVKSGRGKTLMVNIREIVDDIQNEENTLLRIRQNYTQITIVFAYISLIALTLFTLLTCVYAYQIASREIELRKLSEQEAKETSEKNKDLARKLRYGMEEASEEIRKYLDSGIERERLINSLNKMVAIGKEDEPKRK